VFALSREVFSMVAYVGVRSRRPSTEAISAKSPLHTSWLWLHAHGLGYAAICQLKARAAVVIGSAAEELVVADLVSQFVESPASCTLPSRLSGHTGT
jgi:hypothetical protein